MQNAVSRMMPPNDILETHSKLAVKEPDLMRLVLQVNLAAIVDVQSVEAVDAELRQRSVMKNYGMRGWPGGNRQYCIVG